MKTKKELRNQLKSEMSINRVESSIFHAALHNLQEYYKGQSPATHSRNTYQGFTVNTIVDEAYNILLLNDTKISK